MAATSSARRAAADPARRRARRGSKARPRDSLLARVGAGAVAVPQAPRRGLLPSPRVRTISYLPSSDSSVHSGSARSPFTIHKRTCAGLPREFVNISLSPLLELPIELGSRMEPAS
jgi:hypothetical protein